MTDTEKSICGGDENARALEYAREKLIAGTPGERYRALEVISKITAENCENQLRRKMALADFATALANYSQQKTSSK